MIIIEAVEGHPDLVRRYSDKGVMLRQIETGLEYSEAIDGEDTPWTYEETTIPIEQEEGQELPEGQISDKQALNIIFGGDY